MSGHEEVASTLMAKWVITPLHVVLERLKVYCRQGEWLEFPNCYNVL